jgi:hypothetical protein
MVIKSTDSNKKYIGLLFKLLFLLAIGAFVVYKIASPLGNFLFYTFVFYRFIVSKNLVFWSSVLFVMLNMPWGLFYYKPYGWYFSLTSTVGISYVSMFGLIFLLKMVISSPKRSLILKDYFTPFYRIPAFFILFLIVWSFAYGHNMKSIFSFLQAFPAFLLFISIPRLFSRDELLKLSKIIFLFSIVHFAGSLIEIVRPGSFMSLLYFGTPPIGIDYGNELIRFVGGISIHLYAMVMGLYYLSKNDTGWTKQFLWVVVILSWLFILNSATRGWMIASTFLITGYFIYSGLRFKLKLKTFFSVLVILLLGIFLMPNTFTMNLLSAFERLETIEALAEGDDTAGGTLSRLSERGPKVLTRFSESPILGFGFSKVTTDYYDGHVGNHSLLLMGGLVGLAVIWITVLSIVWYIFRADIFFYRPGSFVFGLALISIMIIHSSSRSMVSFYMPTDAAFLIGLIFNQFNADAQYQLDEYAKGSLVCSP